MFTVAIRSRFGNADTGVLGLIYALSASAILAQYVISNWGANSLVDHLLQAALLCAAIGGVWFVLIAAENLRSAPGGRAQTSRDRQAGAAAES